MDILASIVVNDKMKDKKGMLTRISSRLQEFLTSFCSDEENIGDIDDTDN
jgi:hypothetical protein